MMQYLFLEIRVTKTVSARHLLYKQWLCKCYKVYEGTSNLTQGRKCKKTKTSFPKESVENADL